MEPTVGFEPTCPFGAALQKQCRRPLGYVGNKNSNCRGVLSNTSRVKHAGADPIRSGKISVLVLALTRCARPCPRFSARNVGVSAWQLGHRRVRLVRRLFCQLPSMCSTSIGTLPVFG